jgi:hypothetical protein
MNGFVEVTAHMMNPRWVVFDRGKPGTIAHRLGGTRWCSRCFTSPVAANHVCSDIQIGARRWVQASLVAPSQEMKES